MSDATRNRHKTTTREKRRSSARGRRRGALPPAQHTAASFFIRQNFRFICRRERAGGDVVLRDLDLDTGISNVTWRRAGARRTGSATYNWPSNVKHPAGLVVKGDVLRCEVRVRDSSPWRTLWEATVTKATPSLGSKATDLALRSALNPATRSRSDWRYRTDNEHPKGWLADEVTAHAAHRAGVKVGQLPRGRFRIEKLIDKEGSLVDVVTEAWKLEREHSGRRFDVSIARGVLDVVELHEPRYLIPLRKTLIDAVLGDALPDEFASALVLTAKVKVKGSDERKKVKVKVVDRARVRRYGYIVRHRDIDDEDVNTREQLRRHGRRLLARSGFAPFKTATITVPGIPWADRGHATKLNVPELGVSADVFVKSVEHRLSAGGYEMDLVVSVNDPWEADERKSRVDRKKSQKDRTRASNTHGRKRAARSKRRGT